MNVHKQLTLNIQLRDDATLANFFAGGAGENGEIVESINRLLAGTGELFVYLWGPTGSGRTHLLQACCHQAEGVGPSAVYLPLGESSGLSPQIFEGLEALDLVCIDDVNAIAGQRDWEEALFFFYNRARDVGVRLLVAGDAPPMQAGFSLADLASRLAWGMTLRVTPLTDEGKLRVLSDRAGSRGLALLPHVAQFLLHHSNRDMATLFSSLDRLDHASLESQRKLTIPFVKRVLAL